MPLDGTTPIHSLASHVPHLDEATLARLLRNCIVIGAFAEPAPGRIAHTPLSRLLRDADFAGLVRFLAEEDGAAARRALDALEKWPRSRAPHHTGFHLANASSSSSAAADETPFFEVLAREGRTVFFLRRILHDWPDEYCLRILRNIVPALGEGDMVVVCEYLMPERAEAGYEQKAARYVPFYRPANGALGRRC